MRVACLERFNLPCTSAEPSIMKPCIQHLRSKCSVGTREPNQWRSTSQNMSFGTGDGFDLYISNCKDDEPDMLSGSQESQFARHVPRARGRDVTRLREI